MCRTPEGTATRTKNDFGKITEVSLILYKNAQACGRTRKGRKSPGEKALLSLARRSLELGGANLCKGLW